MCEVQPTILAHAKVEVNMSVGIPTALSIRDELKFDICLQSSVRMLFSQQFSRLFFDGFC